jgi:hypothetical protein
MIKDAIANIPKRQRLKLFRRCRLGRSSEAPRHSPAKRRVEPGERGIDAPLTVMDRLVLHKLPREQREGKRRSVPIDRRVDVEGFQRGEQVSLLVIKRREQRLPSSGPT